MKKILGVAFLFIGISFNTYAQKKEEIKKTATPVQKVHNTLSSHKHYNGYKVKEKRLNGHKTVHKVTDPKETVKDKSKKAGDLGKKVQVTHKK